VERWDKAVDSAEVWVLVPRVDGNSEHDFVTLYYDDAANGAVADGQCANCVFAPGNGFSGVWHLNNAGNENAGNYADATGNGYDGTGNSMAAGSSVSALAAQGTAFDGSADYVGAAAGAGSSAAHTVSFWMNADAFGFQSVIDHIRSDGSGVGWNFKLRTSGDSAIWYRLGSEASHQDVVKTGAYSAGKWVHVTGTFDGASTAKLYLNGVLANSSSSITKSANDNTIPLRFGIPSAAQTGEKFSGTLDEVQISSTVRDSNWVKLAYESQRRTGNLFWNVRPGPDNLVALTAIGGVSGISLTWNTPVSDSANADSIGIWVKYSA
jgi:hypothetical protein